MMPLEIFSKISTSSTAHLLLRGKLDAVTAQEFDEYIERSMDLAIRTLIVDLQQVNFLSSAGLRSFAKAIRIFQAREGKVFFVNPSPQVKKVFEIVRVVPLQSVFKDLEELDDYLAHIQKQAGEAR